MVEALGRCGGGIPIVGEVVSAAATAAGYLYASGRLRGKQGRELQSERFTNTNSNAAPQPSTATSTAAPSARPKAEGAGQGDVAVAAPKRIPVVTYKKRRL